MSREIKFRAFINDTMKDVTGLHYMGGSISEVQIHAGNLEFKWYNILDCKIIQFTGLKDKNGKEIYEHDWVKVPSFKPCKMMVEFIEGAFCLTDGNAKYLADIHYIQHAGVNNSEIIGNKYEN